MALWGFQTEIASSKKGIIDQHFSPCYIKPDDLILLGSLFLVFMRIDDEGKISRPKDCQRQNPTLHESTAITPNKLFLPIISATLSSFARFWQRCFKDKADMKFFPGVVFFLKKQRINSCTSWLIYTLYV